LTSTLEPFYTISGFALEAKNAFDGSSVSTNNITCEDRYQIHSNSIKGMEVVSLSDTATMIVAGGDDNSTSVSLLRTSSSTSDTSPDLATISIPDAHAAAVTTVKILDRENIRDSASNALLTKVTFVSSGNDHRVKVWSINVDTTQPGTQGINVAFLLDRYSAVADISSLGLVYNQGSFTSANENASEPRNKEAQLVVCGVGMEMFDVKS
jgi:hypothetical protein